MCQDRIDCLVEDAMGKQALALPLQLDAACQAVDDLAHATEEAFRSHPTWPSWVW
ncbi:hypothetical protein ACWGIU_09705 [Streptomyces sp. NPDC054840]